MAPESRSQGIFPPKDKNTMLVGIQIFVKGRSKVAPLTPSSP